MASAWGKSFGLAFGVAFGALVVTPPEVAADELHQGGPDEGAYSKHYVRPADWKPRHEFDTGPQLAPEPVPVITTVMGGVPPAAVTLAKGPPTSDKVLTAPKTSDQAPIPPALSEADALAMVMAVILLDDD